MVGKQITLAVTAIHRMKKTSVDKTYVDDIMCLQAFIRQYVGNLTNSF